MDRSKTVKVYTLSAALEKGKVYCAYQERSQQEVRDKLYDLGLHKKEVEEGIAILISEGFINEERFAIAFAGGKFRIKQWGRIKIKLALKSKNISDYCILKALSLIDDTDYISVLEKLIQKKQKEVKEKSILKKRYIIARYVLSRGFESDLVWDRVNLVEK